MPIYEFQCEECGKWQEKICQYTDNMVQCSCGGVAIKCVSSPGMFRIEGYNAENGYHKPKEE